MNAPRILITRLSAIGDSIVTAPMICAIRDHYPDAFIAWVTEPGPAQVLRGHSCLDELVIVPRRWMKQPSGYWALRRTLRRLNVDVVLDPQSLSKSALLGWFS